MPGRVKELMNQRVNVSSPPDIRSVGRSARGQERADRWGFRSLSLGRTGEPRYFCIILRPTTGASAISNLRITLAHLPPSAS